MRQAREPSGCPGTLEPLTPALRTVEEERDWYARELDFHIIHAGGPRTLDSLSGFLGAPTEAFPFSRATLNEYDNIAGTVVLDAPARLWDVGLRALARGLPTGFGPGITAEIRLGTRPLEQAVRVRVRT